MKQGVKIFNRLPREKVSQEHFRLLTDISGDLILTEYYDEAHLEDVHINISSLLNMNLEDSSRYAVFQYGQSSLKNEESLFKEWKKQEFGQRKCDISLIIIDHVEEKIYLVCAEVKKTLKINSLHEARQQLISTYIDLNILSSIITYNIYQLNRVFFTISEKILIPEKELPSSFRLLKDKKGRLIPSELLWTEFVTRTFYFSLDSQKDMMDVNVNIEKIDSWVSDRIRFEVIEN